MTTATTCSGERFAEAWEFAAFWCYGQLITGAHEGAMAAPTLTDSQGDFLTRGVQPNVGMILYNLTQGTDGPVTAVTQTTITATGVTWDTADLYRICLINGIEISTIEHYLNVAAGDIIVALAASGQCDCNWSAWALSTDTTVGLLAKLNIIDAAAYYNCKCGSTQFSSGERDNYLKWMSEQLRQLRDGELDICQGATGKNFPAMGWAQQGHSEFQMAQIIWNDILRNHA